ncbi:exopolyphosphatase PRUNE1-like protein [Lates japonicus]|uniref:Exopolyphosphatase PRUNE1-like protein n=1 Tax=Lates japonicus TaxID=270547 RepID=A0AAD3RGN2_LATJO|nr:exopolyphosphatase PRUNE1-like protein [Lates japonicus]
MLGVVIVCLWYYSPHLVSASVVPSEENLPWGLWRLLPVHRLGAVVAMTIAVTNQMSPSGNSPSTAQPPLYRQEPRPLELLWPHPLPVSSQQPYKDILSYHQGNALASHETVLPVSHFLSDWWQRCIVGQMARPGRPATTNQASMISQTHSRQQKSQLTSLMRLAAQQLLCLPSPPASGCSEQRIMGA